MSVVTKEMLDAAVIFGRNQERERILNLLLESRDGLDAILAAESDAGEQLEKLIKGTK